MSWGTRLRWLRTIRGLSQWDLSVKMGASQSTISLFEQSKRQPTDREKEQIERILAWTPETEAALEALEVA